MNREDILQPVNLFVPAGTLHINIILIGCGAINSNVADLLVRIGAQHLTIYDPQTVDRRNLSLQRFDENDVGKPKSIALAERLLRQYPSLELDITAHHCAYEDQPLTDIVVAGPDNLGARRAVWKEARTSEHVALLVDGRTHQSSAQVFTIRPDDEAGDAVYYDNKLVSTLPEAACSDPLLQPMLSSVMVGQVIKFMRAQPYYRHIAITLGGEGPQIQLVDPVNP